MLHKNQFAASNASLKLVQQHLASNIGNVQYTHLESEATNCLPKAICKLSTDKILLCGICLPLALLQPERRAQYRSQSLESYSYYLRKPCNFIFFKRYWRGWIRLTCEVFSALNDPRKDCAVAAESLSLC